MYCCFLYSLLAKKISLAFLPQSAVKVLSIRHLLIFNIASAYIINTHSPSQ